MKPETERHMSIECELLLTAADLLEYVGWCRGAAIRDLNGKEIRSNDEDAAAFCIQGAIWAVGDAWGVRTVEAMNAVSEYRWLQSNDKAIPLLAAWNDRECKSGKEAAELLRRVAEFVEAGCLVR